MSRRGSQLLRCGSHAALEAPKEMRTFCQVWGEVPCTTKPGSGFGYAESTREGEIWATELRCHPNSALSVAR